MDRKTGLITSGSGMLMGAGFGLLLDPLLGAGVGLILGALIGLVVGSALTKNSSDQ